MEKQTERKEGGREKGRNRQMQSADRQTNRQNE